MVLLISYFATEGWAFFVGFVKTHLTDGSDRVVCIFVILSLQPKGFLRGHDFC